MTNRRNLRDGPTAYDCRDRLPGLSGWMSDDAMKLLPLWHAPLERGQVFFDLNEPDRGAFTVAGGERVRPETPYVRMRDVPEWVWAPLVTWKQPISAAQGEELQALEQTPGSTFGR